jgi:hypothetical protein
MEVKPIKLILIDEEFAMKAVDFIQRKAEEKNFASSLGKAVVLIALWTYWKSDEELSEVLQQFPEEFLIPKTYTVETEVEITDEGNFVVLNGERQEVNSIYNILMYVVDKHIEPKDTGIKCPNCFKGTILTLDFEEGVCNTCSQEFSVRGNTLTFKT